MRLSFKFWLAIIGIAAAYVFIVKPIWVGHKKAIISEPFDMLVGIKSALGQFEVDHGFYPKSLQNLVQNADISANWHGPYLKKMPCDPWGRPYVYTCPGRHNADSYDLMSAGPDGKPGTEDDISNWTK